MKALKFWLITAIWTVALFPSIDSISFPTIVNPWNWYYWSSGSASGRTEKSGESANIYKYLQKIQTIFPKNDTKYTLPVAQAQQRTTTSAVPKIQIISHPRNRPTTTTTSSTTTGIPLDVTTITTTEIPESRTLPEVSTENPLVLDVDVAADSTTTPPPIREATRSRSDDNYLRISEIGDDVATTTTVDPIQVLEVQRFTTPASSEQHDDDYITEPSMKFRLDETTERIFHVPTIQDLSGRDDESSGKATTVSPMTTLTSNLENLLINSDYNLVETTTTTSTTTTVVPESKASPQEASTVLTYVVDPRVRNSNRIEGSIITTTTTQIPDDETKNFRFFDLSSTERTIPTTTEAVTTTDGGGLLFNKLFPVLEPRNSMSVDDGDSEFIRNFHDTYYSNAGVFDDLMKRRYGRFERSQRGLVHFPDDDTGDDDSINHINRVFFSPSLIAVP